MPQTRKLIATLIIWWIGDILASSLVWSTFGIFQDLLKGSAASSLSVARVCALVIINALSAWKTVRDLREYFSPYRADHQRQL